MFPIFGYRQSVLISCRSKIDSFGKEILKDDLVVVDWHMPVSLKPPFYAFSIGKSNFSYRLIKKSQAFVVNFMSYEQKEAVMFCNRNSGEHIDKFKKSGLVMDEAEKIDCGRIKEALAFIECEVVEEMEVGDHFIFIGKILNSTRKKTGKRIYHQEEVRFRGL